MVEMLMDDDRRFKRSIYIFNARYTVLQAGSIYKKEVIDVVNVRE